MEMQPSEEQGNSNHAEPLTDTDAVRVSFELDSSEPRDAPESYYQPLSQAAFRGDWEAAKRFFKQDPASLTARITSRSGTVLHIAALRGQDKFFENMVDLLCANPTALEIQDYYGRTALTIAVLCGRIRMVKAIVRCNPNLTQLRDNDGRFPLEISAWEASKHKEIAWFLARNTLDDHQIGPIRSPFDIFLILNLTVAGHHDITLYLLRRYPHFITMKSDHHRDRTILHVLARMPSHFRSGTRLSILEKLIYKCIPVELEPTNENLETGGTVFQFLARSLRSVPKIIAPTTIKRIQEVKLRNVAAVRLAELVCKELLSRMASTEIIEYFEVHDLLAQAISKGITELVKLWADHFPELIWKSDYGKSLRETAVKYRQESILGLFLEGNSINELSFVPTPGVVESERIMLEAARYESNMDDVNKVSGAAFEIQRELQWFSAMEMCIIPDVRTSYHGGKTFREIFMQEHRKLFVNGEIWMRETADKCMLVSTLIATVLFAAVFTVPGGNESTTGVPLLLRDNSLLIFAIFDALGLISSVTSIIFFLAILTSRFEWEDFLESLPKKIIMGLFCLFLSLAFMLVAFVTSLTIVLDKRLEWIAIPFTLLACLPVALFARLQLPLLFQMARTTYSPSIFRAKDIWK